MREATKRANPNAIPTEPNIPIAPKEVKKNRNIILDPVTIFWKRKYSPLRDAMKV